MRPQPEGCGEPCGQRKVVDGGCPLQCGHSPKAVENSAAGGKSTREMTLQCGHSPKAVENRARLFICLTARASMRPQPEGRGELRQPAKNPARHMASMRPQPEGRGEPGLVGRCEAVADRFNAATARRPWRTRQLSEFDLPCVASMRPQPEGRGEQPVAPAPFFATCLGFNAATARRLWRTETAHNNWQAYSRFNAATARRPWRTQTGRF